MPKISSQRKEAILKKLVASKPNNMKKFAKEEGIATSTLYAWINEQPHLMTAMSKNSKPTDFSAKTKLAFVAQSYAMTEFELSQFCRENSLYVEQIEQWRTECLSGFAQDKKEKKQEKHQSKLDKQEIKQLKKELRQKEKALAEAAALLVLRKKLHAFYGEEPEED